MRCAEEAGTVGLRDVDHDGKADIVAYFGDYKDEGGLRQVS